MVSVSELPPAGMRARVVEIDGKQSLIFEPIAPREQTHRERSKVFYASRAWRSLRFKVLEANALKHGGRPVCEVCGTGALPGAPLHVDHIDPLSKNWERRLDPSNLQIMCPDCNLGKSNKSTHDFRQE